MQDPEDVRDFLDDYYMNGGEDDWSVDYRLMCGYNPCFNHTECRGQFKCIGLVLVYWNRFVDWLCEI